MSNKGAITYEPIDSSMNNFRWYKLSGLSDTEKNVLLQKQKVFFLYLCNHICCCSNTVFFGSKRL